MPRTLAVENNDAFSPTPPSDQRGPSCYTVDYYNDEDFRAFYSGQDAANIDDFFTDNGEYLMVYLPEVTDREFLAGLRYGNGFDAYGFSIK